MFSGFTNQMSSIGSWIGAKKGPSGQPEEGSPQNADGKAVDETNQASPGMKFLQPILPIAQNLFNCCCIYQVSNETERVEQPVAAESAKGDLFSSVKNQMSSWLSKKEPTKEAGDQEDPAANTTKQDLPEKIDAGQNEAGGPAETGEAGAEGDKEGFGSGISCWRLV